jgi:hypothetical protein
VDISTAIGAVLAAFGLSGAAGLNAWLPLFVSALLARFDVVELAGAFDELSTTPGLVVLGVLTVADFVGDKVPVVDHVLHVIGGVIAPVSGAILFTGTTGEETSLPTIVSLVLGAIVAGTIHAGRASLRPAATATTGGVGNPVVSFGEDVSSGLLTALAFVVPVLAVAVLVLLVVGAVTGWRRLRGALR